MPLRARSVYFIHTNNCIDLNKINQASRILPVSMLAVALWGEQLVLEAPCLRQQHGAGRSLFYPASFLPLWLSANYQLEQA